MCPMSSVAMRGQFLSLLIIVPLVPIMLVNTGSPLVVMSWFGNESGLSAKTAALLLLLDAVCDVYLRLCVCRSCTVEGKTLTSWHGFLSFVPQMWKWSQTVQIR